jgi:ribA/ribD-fused uncharacterized protein
MRQDSTELICFYERPFYVFSNFSSFKVLYEGRDWMTSEHAYQASKFTTPSIVDEIANARSAHDALQIAKKHKDNVIDNWNDIKVGVMERICEAKLKQHEYIQQLLLETGEREIVEDSHMNSFWGWGEDGGGRNELGKIWMRLRTKLHDGGVKKSTY